MQDGCKIHPRFLNLHNEKQRQVKGLTSPSRTNEKWNSQSNRYRYDGRDIAGLKTVDQMMKIVKKLYDNDR